MERYMTIKILFVSCDYIYTRFFHINTSNIKMSHKVLDNLLVIVLLRKKHLNVNIYGALKEMH